MIQLEGNPSLSSALRDGSEPPVSAAEGQAGPGLGPVRVEVGQTSKQRTQLGV